MSDISMRIVLSASQGNTLSVISGLSSALGTGGLSGALLGIGTAAAAVAVGVGVAAVKMAGDYQAAMNKVQALTGTSTDQMQQYDAGLKNLATDAGVAPQQLADGLYNVVSAGYQGKDALALLGLATKDSVIGMTDASTTTKSLTALLAQFGLGAQDATRVNGEMLDTVTLGSGTFEQYASSIVKSASSASQFGVSLETMNAAYATMTSSQIGAAQASTDFQQSLKVMYGNIGTVTKSLHSNGIAFDEAKFNTLSYGDKVTYLNTALEQANAKHVKVTGVTLQAAQAVHTIAQHTDVYNKDLATLSDRQAMANKTQDAWAITQSGFNQSMNRLGATTQVLMINLGSQLLPVLTKIASNLAPLIAQFNDWITKNHVVENAIAAVSTAIHTTVSVIGGLVTGVQNVIKFFQQNQLAADLLVGALTGIAVAIGVAVIPGMIAAGIAAVASFGAWAVAAGAAAIATLAAAAPFILIGAVVAAVVVGIILAVQHWGEISKWLQGVWSGFSSWFVGALQTLGGFFTGVWHGIQTGLQAAWSFIVNVVKFSAQALFMAVFGPIVQLVNAFQWLYSHNYIFKNLVDSITNFFKGLFSWAQGAWTAATNWLTDRWNWVKDQATSIWGNVSSAVSDKSKQAGNWLQDQWGKATKWLQDEWNKYGPMAMKIWDGVSKIYAGIWNNYIATPLENFWTSLTNWWNGLSTKAAQLGTNLVNWIVGSIKNIGGSIGNAMHDAISSGLKTLGFHDIPGWVGHASGIINSPTGHWAVVGEKGPEMMYVPQGASIFPNNFTPSGGGRAIGGGGGPVFYISISTMARSQAEVQRMVDMVEQEIGHRFRQQTAGYASGGIF